MLVTLPPPPCLFPDKEIMSPDSAINVSWGQTHPQLRTTRLDFSVNYEKGNIHLSYICTSLRSEGGKICNLKFN